MNKQFRQSQTFLREKTASPSISDVPKKQSDGLNILNYVNMMVQGSAGQGVPLSPVYPGASNLSQ